MPSEQEWDALVKRVADLEASNAMLRDFRLAQMRNDDDQQRDYRAIGDRVTALENGTALRDGDTLKVSRVKVVP